MGARPIFVFSAAAMTLCSCSLGEGCIVLDGLLDLLPREFSSPGLGLVKWVWGKVHDFIATLRFQLECCLIEKTCKVLLTKFYLLK